MAVSIDSRIWLAAHLLYPNSSQAFDVYQTLVSQSEISVKKNNAGSINSIFQKLYQIVEKIPAISSNKAFHVFEEERTEQWRLIYKKSQKEQLIIFLGFFIFNLDLNDIAGILKLSLEKAQFLFHQTFKKSVFANIKVEVADKISLKKFNEEKVSFLFTNENLIDYCLKKLSSADMKKVKVGLQLYPELAASQKQFDLIVEQMNYLMDSQATRVTKTLIQISDTLSEPREAFQINNIFFNNKKLVFSALLTVFFLFIFTIRPQWIQHVSQTKNDHFVDLQEVKPQAHVVENIGEPRAVAPSISASLDATQPVVVAAIAVEEVKKPIEAEPSLPKPAAVPIPKHEVEAMAQSKKVGGLYRGVLTVTDLNEVTDKITEKLVDIGGKKAGEVELGWRKTEKLSYYHLTLPENNVDAMKEFLTKFGDLKIQFENHPRLMPAGIKRLIIEVKERE